MSDELKMYYVQLPVVGIIGFEIEAESEEDAIEKALNSDQITSDNFEEWDVVESVCKGNVCYAPLFDAEAEEI